MGNVAIKEFVGSKSKIYLILMSDSSEYKKAKGVNKCVLAKVTHNEYKDALLKKSV